MKYLAVLGRQPEISIAELEASDFCIDINRLGGTQKLAVKLEGTPLDYLKTVEDGKITLGVSDYSKGASRKSAMMEALRLKKILVRHGRSVRVVEGKDAALGTATSLHNGLSGKNPRKCEFIKTDDGWYRVIGVQDIDAYAKRDQARPARDAKVGMLPPKLAQILINLCGPLPEGATVLDPFCGTGVVLQEALLMGYKAQGTDLSEKMVEYTKKNLQWLTRGEEGYDKSEKEYTVAQGDATSYQWTGPIDAVACEGYLGKPMSNIPAEIKLKTEKQECKAIIIGFLKNLAGQVKPGTPVVIAAPAWLRENGEYSRLEILDEIKEMGYNVSNKSCEGLVYHREGQIVARDIIILRKK